MPNCVKQVGLKWRVVECDSGKITKNAKGTAVDGGGYDSKSKAQAQASAINISQSKKKK